MSVYQDFALLSVLNLNTANWDTSFSSENYSNNLSIVVLVLILAVPPLILVHLYREYEQWDDENFNRRFGTLIDGRRTNNNRWAVILMLTLFFVRRLVFVITVIHLQDFVWGQILIQISFSIGMLMFIQLNKPFKSSFANWIETFNEVCTLLLSYMAICFTNFIPDAEIKSDIGPYYVYTNLVMIAVNVLILALLTLKTWMLCCKKCCCQKNNKVAMQQALR